LRTNLFHIVLLAFFLTIGSPKIHAQEIGTTAQKIPSKDTTAVKLNENSVTKIVDSIAVDSVKTKPRILESKVHYKSSNYAKLDQQKKTITLYDKAELYYKDIELKAGIIVFNYALSYNVMVFFCWSSLA